MDKQILQQLGGGLLFVVLGLAAWLLPYRWNVFRLKRLYRDFVSERVNRLIPKMVGTILLLFGVLLLLATALVGKLQ